MIAEVSWFTMQETRAPFRMLDPPVVGVLLARSIFGWTLAIMHTYFDTHAGRRSYVTQVMHAVMRLFLA
jgi:hypothetical protein